MKVKKTTVGYIRVSTEEQVREGYSLDNQVEEIGKKCVPLLIIHRDHVESVQPRSGEFEIFFNNRVFDLLTGRNAV